MEGNDAKRIAAKTEELGTETGRLFQAASAASAGTGAAQSGKAGEYISSELFLLAAVEDKGALGELLRAAGATEAALGQAVDQVRGGERIEDADAEDQRQALEKYTIDLTERAEQGKLDPVVGRDDEIRRTVQVLHRRTKNNPVLIGDPGVRPRSSRAWTSTSLRRLDGLVMRSLHLYY